MWGRATRSLYPIYVKKQPIRLAVFTKMCIFAVALSYGVMVAQQVLVLFVVVRIRLGQRLRRLYRLLFLFLLLQDYLSNPDKGKIVVVRIRLGQLKRRLERASVFVFAILILGGALVPSAPTKQKVYKVFSNPDKGKIVVVRIRLGQRLRRLYRLLFCFYK